MIQSIDPEALRPMFRGVLRQVQRGKILEQYVDVLEHRMYFILGAKEGDHPLLFEQVKLREGTGAVTNMGIRNLEPKSGLTHRITIMRDVPWKQSHPDPW